MQFNKIIYPVSTAIFLFSLTMYFTKHEMVKVFFFDTALANGVYLNVKDGGQWLAVTAIAMLIISRIFDSKIFTNQNHLQ